MRGGRITAGPQGTGSSEVTDFKMKGSGSCAEERDSNRNASLESGCYRNLHTINIP